jgi:hypothetical protein
MQGRQRPEPGCCPEKGAGTRGTGWAVNMNSVLFHRAELKKISVHFEISRLLLT